MKLLLRFSLGFLLSLLPLASTFLRADEPVSAISLDKLLTAAEFQNAGLSKLTPAELNALSVALARFKDLTPVGENPTLKVGTSAGVTAAVASKTEAASFGAEQVAQINPVVTEKELHSRIEGTLESINGRSVFLLDNGQIWQQRIPETIHFSPRLTNPTVVITRGLMGYKMLIVEADRFIYVKRIK